MLLSVLRSAAQDFNDWFAIYGATATTEPLKSAASREQKQDILQKVCPQATKCSTLSEQEDYLCVGLCMSTSLDKWCNVWQERMGLS
jgi:hypothetical protein